jgi:transcriptional regulator with XRE-family HTH domain
MRQIDVAVQARVAQATVSRAEAGRLVGVSMAALEGIAAALDVTLFLDAK